MHTCGGPYFGQEPLGGGDIRCAPYIYGERGGLNTLLATLYALLYSSGLRFSQLWSPQEGTKWVSPSTFPGGVWGPAQVPRHYFLLTVFFRLVLSLSHGKGRTSLLADLLALINGVLASCEGECGSWFHSGGDLAFCSDFSLVSLLLPKLFHLSFGEQGLLCLRLLFLALLSKTNKLGCRSLPSRSNLVRSYSLDKK